MYLSNQQNATRGGGAARGDRRWARPGDRGLVRRQRARLVLAQERGARRLLHLRGRPGGVPRARVHDRRARARTVRRPLPPGVEPGGLPRPRRRVRAADRGRRAAVAPLGLRPLPAMDGARLRRGGRRSMRHLHDRRAHPRERGRLPELRARAATRRRRRAGDDETRRSLLAVSAVETGQAGLQRDAVGLAGDFACSGRIRQRGSKTLASNGCPARIRAIRSPPEIEGRKPTPLQPRL
jgi:hypothetical protein